MPDIIVKPDGSYRYKDSNLESFEEIKPKFNPEITKRDVEDMEIDPKLVWGKNFMDQNVFNRHSPDRSCMDEDCKKNGVDLFNDVDGAHGDPFKIAELVVGIRPAGDYSKPRKKYAMVIECPECHKYSWAHCDNSLADLIYQVRNNKV